MSSLLQLTSCCKNKTFHSQCCDNKVDINECPPPPTPPPVSLEMTTKCFTFKFKRNNKKENVV
jgi:hypothetical protein